MRCASLHAVSPAGLVIDRVTTEADHLLVIAHPIAPDAACTACGERSAQIHSRYERRLMDLPSHGQCVRLLFKFAASVVAMPDVVERSSARCWTPILRRRRRDARRGLRRLSTTSASLWVGVPRPVWPAA